MGGVGQRIRELRKAAHLTQQELADGVVTRSYISQIEKGMIQPSYDTLEKLANKLSVPVEDFFKEPENMALLVTDAKKYIRFAEGQVESGQREQAKRTLENVKPEALDELNDFDLGLLTWVRGALLEDTDRDEAIGYFHRSLEHLSNVMYVKERVRTLNSLGYVHSVVRRDDQAIKTLNEAYELVLQHQVGGLIKVSVLVNLGLAHAKIEEYQSAVRLLTEALEINRQTEAHYKSGHIFGGLALCYMFTDQWERSEELYRRAIDFYRAQEDIYHVGANYLNLGIQYRKRGMLQEAQEATRTSIHWLTMNQREKGSLGNAWLEMAMVYLELGQLEQADEAYEKSLAVDSTGRNEAFGFEVKAARARVQQDEQQALFFLGKAYVKYKELGLKREIRDIERSLTQPLLSWASSVPSSSAPEADLMRQIGAHIFTLDPR
ncbi:MAG TPA: tetratricopeptide repeat protein [Bacilli bacterium]|nr:tetratricopeptide repeat protein [Bacilli bacterium]